MALATHSLKGSCTTLTPLPSLWSRGNELKYFVPKSFNVAGRKHKSISLKCRLCSGAGASLLLWQKSKPLQLHAHKESDQSTDFGGRVYRSKPLNNFVEVSYVQHKSEGSSVESSSVQNIFPSLHTETDEATTNSHAINNLFQKWLMLLHTPSQTQEVEKEHAENFSTGISKMPNYLDKQSGENLRAVWYYFVGVDAAIKHTVLPCCWHCIWVRSIKRMTPLWILGPVIVAQYIKMFQSLCRLYAFCFNWTTKLVKSLLVYFLLARDYILLGNLKEALKTFIFQPLADLTRANYNDLSWRKMKDLLGWMDGRYLDFLESVWPYCFRTHRFLKRANFFQHM